MATNRTPEERILRLAQVAVCLLAIGVFSVTFFGWMTWREVKKATDESAVDAMNRGIRWRQDQMDTWIRVKHEYEGIGQIESAKNAADLVATLSQEIEWYRKRIDAYQKPYRGDTVHPTFNNEEWQDRVARFKMAQPIGSKK